MSPSAPVARLQNAYRTLVGVAVASTLAAACLAVIPAAALASGGNTHQCAVMTDHTVTCWGNGTSGQLGDGNGYSRSVPVTVSGISNAVQVSQGDFHSCAVLSTGEVKCWGNNFYGSLGDGTTSTTTTPVTVSGISTAVQVSAGQAFACAVLASGGIKCWGQNTAGKLGSGYKATELPNSLVPLDVYGISNATQVSADGPNACAVLTTGVVMCWGSNAGGQIGDGTPTNRLVPVPVYGITNATQVSVSYQQSACAVLATGGVKCWGRNATGQLGNGESGAGAISRVPVDVDGITNASQVSVGFDSSCALLSSGSVKCWGNATYGQLGDGTTTASSFPVVVSGLSNASRITAGKSGVCAVLADSGAKCWGYNNQGQLGNGYFATPSSVAVSVVSSSGSAVSGFSAMDLAAPPAADLTAPDAPVLSNTPASLTKSTSASISFTGEANASFACSVDNGSYAPCTSPKVLSGLGDGSHSLSVTATDKAGNKSSAAVANWTVDATAPPALVFSGAPASFTVSTSALVSFTGEANATFTCSVDGGAYSACTSPKGLSELAIGGHRLSVKAADLAGNVSTSTVSWNVVIVGDGPPSVPVLTAPLTGGSFAVGAIVPFSATADTGSVLECKLDSGSWGSCPVSYTPGDGSKIAVGWLTRLVFGQELGTSNVDVGQLHYGAHAYSALTGQDAGTRFADAVFWGSDSSLCDSFPYGSEYGGAYGVVLNSDNSPTSLSNEFSLDCSITSKYSTGDLLQELAAGRHTLAVRATNGTGTSAPANLTFTIGAPVAADTTVPDAPVLSGAPSSPTNSTTASVSFTGETDATFTCSVDGGEYEACTSPKELNGLSAGAHSLSVWVTDLAGNSSSATSASWTVQGLDTTAPTLDSGAGTVGKPTVLKGAGYDLTGAVGSAPTPTFQWQRCTTLNDASSCSALTGVAGSDGAWWGTRDADIGYQLRLSVSWSTVQGVKNALSALSGLVTPSVTAVPVITYGTNPFSNRSDSSPVKGVRQHSSFGTWSGYIAGVSSVAFEWQTCVSGSDVSSCSASATTANNQWYTPTAADVGKYLRTKATITTRGQTAIGYSAVSYVRATRLLCRQAAVSARVRARATVISRHGKRGKAARARAHMAC